MSDFRRRLMMLRKSEGGLPSGYTRIKYLESTGTQYIDTEIKPTINTKCELGVEMLSNTVGLIGYVHGNDNNDYRLFLYANVLYFDFKNYRISRSGYSLVNNYTQFEIGNYYVKVNDSKFLSGAYVNEFTADYNMYLFKFYPLDTVGFVYKLYYLKIYDNDKIIRNFVPALDTKNKPCLYDTVSKKPFYNQGTGEFLYG